MKSRTVKELRAEAKTRGIRGYSKLTKEALIRELEADGAQPSAPAAERAPAKPEAAATPPRPRSEQPPAPGSAGLESAEQLVENAKYALRPGGAPAKPALVDLDEDIDRLPDLTQPVVALLPQKPGILHAYWTLPPGETGRREDYQLRLCRAEGDALDVQEEVPVRSDCGSWYFHLPPERAEPGALLVQLGYFENGRFVSAGGRGVARLPTLYASTQTDQRWWIDEAEFTRMYLRAGGFVTPARSLGWAASIGSPGPGAPPGPEERLGWPGGIGSPAK